MSSNIPPKPRCNPRLLYYTAGEGEKVRKPGRFRSHISEPDAAAKLLQRNPHNSDEIPTKIKSSYANPKYYTPGLYSGRFDTSKNDTSLLFPAYSLTEAKVIKSREYAR